MARPKRVLLTAEQLQAIDLHRQRRSFKRISRSLAYQVKRRLEQYPPQLRTNEATRGG
jgi:hypothetical protein